MAKKNQRRKSLGEFSALDITIFNLLYKSVPAQVSYGQTQIVLTSEPQVSYGDNPSIRDSHCDESASIDMLIELSNVIYLTSESTSAAPEQISADSGRLLSSAPRVFRQAY
jgi:hypothetical protein